MKSEDKPDGLIRFLRCAFDPVNRRLYRGGKDVTPGPTAVRLLEFFISKPNTPLGRSKLVESVWADSERGGVNNQTVDKHVQELRDAMGDTPPYRYIFTERRIGYRFRNLKDETTKEVEAPDVIALAREEVRHLIAAAHTERNQLVTIKLLKDAISLCQKWKQSSLNEEVTILEMQSAADLAVEQSNSGDRKLWWLRTIETFSSLEAETFSPELAYTFGYVAVDCYQDNLSDLNMRDRIEILRDAGRVIDKALETRPGNIWESRLLCRKSSILRQRAHSPFDPNKRYQEYFLQARTCAERARHLFDSGEAALEYGLCLWSLARVERGPSDLDFIQKLKTAEQFMRRAAEKSSDSGLREAAVLTLVMFYMQLDIPLQASQYFLDLSRSTKRTRRILRHAYLQAEASIRLWYKGYPPTHDPFDGW